MIGRVLLVVLLACGGRPSERDDHAAPVVSAPSRRPAALPPPTDRDVADAATLPALADLEPSVRAAAVAALGVTPVPCACGSAESVLACASQDEVCGVVPRLVARAAHLAQSGAGHTAILQSLALGDGWVEPSALAPDAVTGPDDAPIAIDVFADTAASDTVALLAAVAGVVASQGGQVRARLYTDGQPERVEGWVIRDDANNGALSAEHARVGATTRPVVLVDGARVRGAPSERELQRLLVGPLLDRRLVDG